MSNGLVLLVDDVSDLIKMYSERLKLAGYDVVVARDGQQGYEAAKSVKPGLILLDIMMPKVNGLDALKMMRAEPALAKVPIIMLTALIQDTNREKGLLAGANGYLVKSKVVPRDLVAMAKKYLATTTTA